MTDDRFPDFHIVGAPKCGSSALYTYLADHPSIAMSARKEPSFWASDINLPHQQSRAAYFSLWDGASSGALRGEASTRYARSRVAIPSILAATPRAKFIMMLRNPVEMAPAFHAQAVKDLQEDVADFEAAWRLQEARASGRAIPRECVHPEFLGYRRVCALGEQLDRFMAVVPPAQRLIILHEELAGDTRGTYLQVLAFLGLPDDGRKHFPRVNEHLNRRSTRLAAAHHAVRRRLGRLYAPFRAAAGRMGFHPTALLDRLNRVPGTRPPLRAAFEAELRQAFEPEIAKIETLLQRSLSHWRASPATGLVQQEGRAGDGVK